MRYQVHLREPFPFRDFTIFINDVSNKFSRPIVRHKENVKCRQIAIRWNRIVMLHYNCRKLDANNLLKP